MLVHIFRFVKACFIKKWRKRKSFLNLGISPISVRERNVAEKFIVKLIQTNPFGELYLYIKSLNGNICHKVAKKLKCVFHPLKTLSVFCDENGSCARTLGL